MSFSGYLKDKAYAVVLAIAGMTLSGVYLRMTGMGYGALSLFLAIWLLMLLLYSAADYFFKRKTAIRLLTTARQLKQRYLVSEVIGKPYRQEYAPYYELLRMGNKAMIEEITRVANERREYREYVEQWVHEVKTPLAVIQLICANNPSECTRKIRAELDKTQNFVEQALFYARSESLEQDYLVREVSLEALVSETIAANKQLFLAHGVGVSAQDLNCRVLSDAKWLEFILKQLFINAVQYRGDNPKIRVFAKVRGNEVLLTVRDNGIGILESELGRVFEKGFTGTNGRRENKSTGIGLYLCKRLCDKMGLEISVDSKAGEYTAVTLAIPAPPYENVSQT